MREGVPLLPARRLVVFAHPLEGASLAAKALLSWVEPALAAGARRLRAPGDAPALQQADVWELPPPERCGPAAARLERAWFAAGSLRAALLRAEAPGLLALAPLYAAVVACDLLAPAALFHALALLGGAADPSEESPPADPLLRRQELHPLRPLAFWLGAVLASRAARALLLAFVGPELQVTAARLAGALRALVLQKATRVHTEDAGDVMRIYTDGLTDVQHAVTVVHQLWGLPFELVAGAALLSWLLGSHVICLALIGASVVTFAVYIGLDVLQRRAVARVADAKHGRSSVVAKALGRVGTNSAAAALAIVKLHAWERKLTARIADAREKELSTVWTTLGVSSAAVVAFYTLPYLLAVTMVSFYCYRHDGVVTIEDVAAILGSLALLRLLQTPLRALPRVLAVWSHAKTSLVQLEEFFEVDETHDTRDIADANAFVEAGSGDGEDVIIDVHDAIFQWTEKKRSSSTRPLRVPDLRVFHEELVIVRGRPSSGRSSFLSALLGDMPLVQTSSRRSAVTGPTPLVSVMSGRVAYCGRRPWLLAGRSLRDNILMGDVFDRRRYLAVLKATALLPDLRRLSAGDLTVIARSSQGDSEYVGLSNGAAWRLTLARACYHRDEVDLFLLDAGEERHDDEDGRAIQEAFTRCVLGLLSRKTRVYVAPFTCSSTFEAEEELAAATGADVRSITIKNGVVVETREDDRVEGDEAGNFTIDVNVTLKVKAPSPGSPNSISVVSGSENSWMSLAPRLGEDVVIDNSSGLTFPAVSDANDFNILTSEDWDEEDEDAPIAISPVSVWRALLPRYLSSAGGNGERLGLLLVGVQAMILILYMASDTWLVFRADVVTTKGKAVLETAGVFALIAGVGCLLVIARAIVVAASGFRAARLAFDRAVTALLLSRIDFLLFRGDQGSGVVAIVQKLLMGGGNGGDLDDDVATIDLRLPLTCGALLSNLLSAIVPLASAILLLAVLVIVILVLASTTASTPSVLAAALAPLALVASAGFYIQWLARSYLPTARAVRVLARRAASNATRFAQNTVPGASTLRALGPDHVDAFVGDHVARLDVHARNAHLRVYADEWITLRLRLVGVLLSGSVVVASSALVLATTDDQVSIFAVALAAIVLLHTLTMDDALVAVFRSWARLETSVSTMGTGKGGESSGDALALVRVMELATRARALAEPPHVVPSAEPPLAWPSEGHLMFQSVQLRVSDPLIVPGSRSRSSAYSQERDGELSLDGLSFQAAPGEKLGLLLANKRHDHLIDSMGVSNVTAALCRLRDLTSGQILVDGVNLAALGLGSLRSRLAVISLAPARCRDVSIPTVRGFLDPFDQCSTLFLFGGDPDTDDSNADRFWAALKRVGLYEKVSRLERSLHAQVDPSNFSLSDRRLLCIARAILLRSAMRMPEAPKVVVLDVDDMDGDAEVDDGHLAHVQGVVHREFASSTVLTVAHRRVASVSGSDRILVVVDGKDAIEAESPVEAEALLAEAEDEHYDEYDEYADDDYE